MESETTVGQKSEFKRVWKKAITGGKKHFFVFNARKNHYHSISAEIK